MDSSLQKYIDKSILINTGLDTVMKQSLLLIRSKHFPCYFIFLVVTGTFVLYRLIGWTRFGIKVNLGVDINEIYTQKSYRNNFVDNYQPFCGPHTLSVNKNVSNKGRFSKCHLSPVSHSGCDNIFKRYYQTTPVPKCHAELSVKLCWTTHLAGYKRFAITCNFHQCNRDMLISVGILEPLYGNLIWHHFVYNNVSEKTILDLANASLLQKNPFMFIECKRNVDSQLLTQLLILPLNRGTSKKLYSNESVAHPVNINLILIDSVSRQHFYRTLPNTVRYLQKLRSTKEWEVLDFELFQSIKGRTFENLKALFEGEVHEIGEKFEGTSVPPTSVEFYKLLSKFKQAGYDTLYQEDLCWEHHWGLIRDIGVFKLKLAKDVRFTSFMNAIARNSIENLGMTHSSCEVFRRLGIIDHFNYLGSLCIGGEYMHDYFLRYVCKSLESHNNRPLLSFLLINVGHEGTGLRIRTFDDSLMKFLTSSRRYQSTVHILFSDHGNSYGPFSRTAEGHLETFHPFLFMLIPRKLAMLLGQQTMRDLRNNQRSLISILDLHFTLTGLLSLLVKDQKKKLSHGSNLGLLAPIYTSRSCDDLNLHRGTLCFCNGWRTSLPTTSVHYLIAEFILAKITRKIYKSQQKLQISNRFCQKLNGIAVMNVWQRIKRERILIGLDIQVQGDNLFSCTISCAIDTPDSFEIKIEEIQRRSSFGIYQTCADHNVPLKFCICSIEHQKGVVYNRLPGTPTASMFSVLTGSLGIHNDCLYILTRSYHAGTVFEASNACSNVTYTVRMTFQLDNMKLAAPTYKRVVSPSSVAHLAVVIMDQPGVSWNYKYTTDISWKGIKKNVIRDLD